jgi:hypothetical protein
MCKGDGGRKPPAIIKVVFKDVDLLTMLATSEDTCVWRVF